MAIASVEENGQPKPMAISTITYPNVRTTTRESSKSPSSVASSSSSRYDYRPPHLLLSPTSLPSPYSDISSLGNSPVSQRCAQMTWCSAVNQLSNDKPDTIMYSRDDGYSSYRHVPNYECLPQHILDASTTGGSLSLGERRQRNKIASAKYRAKKNQQQGEMRSMIIAMSKENEVMARQLDQLCQENTRLKAMCDKLRGKMMAQKMLKQFLNHTSSAHTQANPSQADTIFEQDMDLSNSEEEEMACQL